MFRKSLVLLLERPGRTIVRDPRRIRNPKSLAVAKVEDLPSPEQTKDNIPRAAFPFEPNPQNQSNVGSSLASYALAGVGVTLGVVLVRIVLGF